MPERPTGVKPPRVFQFSASWPPASLSPNGGMKHWAALYRAKRLYTELVWYDVIMSVDGNPARIPHFGRAVMDLEFVPPRNQIYDLDNCIARFKSGQDVLGQGNRNSRGVIVRPGVELVEDDDPFHLQLGSVTLRYRHAHEREHVLVTLRELPATDG